MIFPHGVPARSPLLRFSLKSRWEAGFGQTWADNSIHRTNNKGVYDHTVGGIAQIARHFGKLGNDAVAFVTDTPKRPAYSGIYGQTRADLVEVLKTPWDVLTKDHKIGRLINGVTSAFDVVYDGLVVDPLTIAAGDHANKPTRIVHDTHKKIAHAVQDDAHHSLAA